MLPHSKFLWDPQYVYFFTVTFIRTYNPGFIIVVRVIVISFPISLIPLNSNKLKKAPRLFTVPTTVSYVVKNVF